MSASQNSFKFPTTFAAKRKARRFALQGLYEWQMTKNPVHEIEARTRAKMPCIKWILPIIMSY